MDEPRTPLGHIAEWDPARVLREIAAKRAVLKAFAEVAKNYGRDDVEYADGWVSGLAFAVPHLATVYSDRPGYREDWRPRSD